MNDFLTLGTQRDLTNDMLIKGIIDSVVTVNQFYMVLPFKGIQGNALAYNREMKDIDQTTLVNVVNTGHTSINKDQQTFSRHSTELTTIIGDAQVNGLIQAVGSDYNDATAVQVAAKAKGLGRRYMDLLINGNERAVLDNGSVPTDFATVVASVGAIFAVARATATNIDAAAAGSAVLATSFDNAAEIGGAVSLTLNNVLFTGPFGDGTGSATLTTSGAALYNAASSILNGYTAFDGISVLAGSVQGASTGLADRLNYLDQLIDSVHDKDGMVDYIMANSRGVRKITAAFRDAGTGFDMMDVKTSSGSVMSVQSYRGVPIFRNDFVGSTATERASTTGGNLTGTAADDIYVGTLDDGSFTHGICGLTALKSAGMQVQKLGAREEVDADITRVKWYCGLAHFSELGLVKGSLV